MSHDNWTDDNDFLSGALHGAADQMPGGEVDDLQVSFGVVRDRVRRRRAAKIGGVTGASLVLVGALAFGATQTSLLDSEPVLPGAPTEESGPPASSVIQDGYTPDWLTDIGADLTCGMPVADLETTAQGWSVASTGDIYSRTTDHGDGATPSSAWGMAATAQGDAGTLDVPPVLVWSQHGVVVDLGANVFGAPVQGEPLLGAGDGAVEAQGNASTTCAPTENETVDFFETPLPEGDYEVRVVAFPEVTPGRWSTAVSEPVAVQLDADGAHSPTGTRGGEATIEPPEPAEGEQSRFVLDRTTDWATAGVTYRGFATPDSMSATGRCESSNSSDRVSFEIVRQSNQQVLGSGFVDCDGGESIGALGPLDGAEESLDLRLGDVPDGVARLWVVLAPSGSAIGGGGNEEGNEEGDGSSDGSSDSGSAAGGDAGGDEAVDPPDETARDCSAAGMSMVYDPASLPGGEAGATAQAIVEAASACDSAGLIELASQYPTELLVPAEPAEQVFALPEDDAQHYRMLVTLLAGTQGADSGEGTIVWPRVAVPEFADSAEAWDEAVEAGLLTADQAQAQRAEPFGYTGMRIGIDAAGTWRYYSATP